jgi:hypothetical protein
MVELPSRLLANPAAHSGKAVATVYEQISRLYAAMPLDGCTDAQRAQAKRLVETTQALADDAAKLPDSNGAEGPALPANARFAAFMSRLEEFEHCRTAMQQDLEKMRAVRLR